MANFQRRQLLQSLACKRKTLPAVFCLQPVGLTIDNRPHPGATVALHQYFPLSGLCCRRRTGWMEYAFTIRRRRPRSRNAGIWSRPGCRLAGRCRQILPGLSRQGAGSFACINQLPVGCPRRGGRRLFVVYGINDKEPEEESGKKQNKKKCRSNFETRAWPGFACSSRPATGRRILASRALTAIKPEQMRHKFAAARLTGSS
jgi:hypothetical protein